MSRLEEQREMYKYKKTKQRLIKIIFGCIFLIGLLVVLTPTAVERVIIPHMLDKANAEVKNVDAKSIEANKKRIKNELKSMDADNYGDASNYDKNLSYNPDNIRSIDRIPTNVKVNNDYVIGKLYIPNINLNIAVLEGLTNANLDVASGTMKPNQEMGKRNFAIAGHHMIDQNLLFTPLVKAKEYDDIYLSDKKDVYEYITTSVKVVDKHSVNIIDDSEGDGIITLMTCSDINGTARIIVRGKFMKKYPIANATEEVKNAILN